MLNADKRRIAEILRSEERNCDVTVKGWVRTKRGNKNVAFIALNDGSCVSNIQVVVDVAQFDQSTINAQASACGDAAEQLLVGKGAVQIWGKQLL